MSQDGQGDSVLVFQTEEMADCHFNLGPRSHLFLLAVTSVSLR